jgi:hypothetical protein
MFQVKPKKKKTLLYFVFVNEELINKMELKLQKSIFHDLKTEKK